MLRAMFVALIVLTGLLAKHAFADVPKEFCPKGCEYLVRNHSGTYPDDRERAAGHWQCYDGTASVACTFVRGNDIRKYRDVYRPGSLQSCLDKCPTKLGRPEYSCARLCEASFSK